jgi:hypothetical protein
VDDLAPIVLADRRDVLDRAATHELQIFGLFIAGGLLLAVARRRFL